MCSFLSLDAFARIPKFMYVYELLLILLSELQNAGLYCLTELINSASAKKHGEKINDNSCVDLFDNIQSPFASDTQNRERSAAGDSERKYDCQPDYMAEELCKSLINLYQRFSLDIKKYEASQGEI